MMARFIIDLTPFSLSSLTRATTRRMEARGIQLPQDRARPSEYPPRVWWHLCPVRSLSRTDPAQDREDRHWTNRSGDAGVGREPPAIEVMIASAAEAMYRLGEENRFLEVTYASGDKDALYFKDCASGAMIESVVNRRSPQRCARGAQGERGPAEHHQPGRLGEDRGMKGERSVYVKPLAGAPKEKRKDIERVVAEAM
jgi:hypothetical protein